VRARASHHGRRRRDAAHDEAAFVVVARCPLLVELPATSRDVLRAVGAHAAAPLTTDVPRAPLCRRCACTDLDGSGTIDKEEIRKFLTSMGHKSTGKAVENLIKAADEGTKDSKLALKEFARVYHGVIL
jgi:hypothetical protein